MPRCPVTPEIDEMLTMAPPPILRICGTAYFIPRKTPRALTPMICSQAAVSNRSSTALPLIPALLTRMSSRPNSATVASTTACQLASSVTSRWWKRAVPLAATISATTLLPSSSSRSATTTVARSRAKMRAMLAPMPDAAPVISATLSASLMISSRPRFGPPSVDLDRLAHGVADRRVQYQIGHPVEPGRLAVDDDQPGAVALGDFGKPGRRVDDQGRAEHDKQVGRQGFLL